MYICGVQTETEAQKVKGYFEPNPIRYGFKDVYKWNNYTRRNECIDCVEDPDKWTVDGTIGEYVKSGFCRCCRKKITPYRERFYKKTFEYASWHSWLYSFSNGYCKKCAVSISKNLLSENQPLYETKRIRSSSYTYDYMRREFSDGSYIEETSLGNDWWYRDTNHHPPKK